MWQASRLPENRVQGRGGSWGLRHSQSVLQLRRLWSGRRSQDGVGTQLLFLGLLLTCDQVLHTSEPSFFIPLSIK